MSKFSRVYEGGVQVLVDERNKIRKDAEKVFTESLELDERMITLRLLQNNNPLVKGIIEVAIREFVSHQLSEQKFPSSWIDYQEKDLIKGRLELIRNDWSQYTLEELASLVKNG